MITATHTVLTSIRSCCCFSFPSNRVVWVCAVGVFFSSILWSLSLEHARFDRAFVQKCCMLLFILHWMSLESNWQICRLLFISFHTFAFGFFLPLLRLDRAELCVCFFSFVFCCVCLAGSMRILFYLHYTIFFIFYVALSFHSCSIFFIHTAVLVHRFYGAKFIFTAYVHTHALNIVAATFNMLCTAFHHNLWIWIPSCKKGRGITHRLQFIEVCMWREREREGEGQRCMAMCVCVAAKC